MRSSPDWLGDDESIDVREISLMRIVQDLGVQGTPLCEEFAEMILADVATNAPEYLRGGAAGEAHGRARDRSGTTAARILLAVIRYAGTPSSMTMPCSR
jgi:hypothetical protein